MKSPLDNLCGPGNVLTREEPDPKEYSHLINDGLNKLNDAESDIRDQMAQHKISTGTCSKSNCAAALDY